MEEFGFPPRISHVKEAISLLKGGVGGYTGKIGRNYLSRFLDRHPELVAKLSSSFDKRRIKASNPETIRSHFSRIQQARMKENILESNMYHMDEKGFRQGISDRAKVICVRRDRDLQLERETNRKWREAQRFAAPIDRRELQAQASSGKVLDAATLKFLYEERERIDAKKATRHKKAGIVTKPGKGKQVQLDISDQGSSGGDTSTVLDTSDSGAELENWEDDLTMDLGDASMKSVITMATPNLR